MNAAPSHTNGKTCPVQRAFLIVSALLIISVLFFPAVTARDVRVALPELPPSLYTDEQGKPAGIFVDMIEDVAVQEGWNIIWVRGTLAENWDRLSSGEVDLMPGVVVTPEREKLYDFSHEPALSLWSQVYALPGSGIQTILDLDGKRVAVVKGDFNGVAFRDYARKFNVNVTYVEKDTLDDVYATTAKGDTDALVAFGMGGEKFPNNYGLTMTTVMFNPTSLNFAVIKGKNADVLQAIDRYLVEGKADPHSRYSQTMQKWFGMRGASQVIPPYIWWGLAGIAGFAVLFVVMSVILRREVRKKTAELVRKNEELGAANQQLTAIEEELRQNYQTLSRSEQALLQARKKLTLLNRLTFQDVQTGVFSLGGYLQLIKGVGCSENAQPMIGKGEEIIHSVESSLHFAKKYQDLGINEPRWQNVNYVLLSALSHMDVSRISRTVDLGNLEIYADPLLEDVFVTLMENALIRKAGPTEIRVRYRQDGRRVTILVEDTGSGIPAEEKERIFEWEYKGQGGPALFLAREILSITGISIAETGEPGSGARFEISVPDGGYRFGRTE